MTWEVFTGGFCQTNAYLLSSGGRHLLVDAPDDCAEWLRGLGVTIDALLLTHQHFDHVMDVARVAKEHRCPIYAWTQPSPELWLNTMFSEMTGWALEIQAYVVGHELAGHLQLDVCGVSFRLFHVPGHSPDSLCFYHVESAQCFCGDTVFASGIGRSDFPGGNEVQLVSGIREKLLTLPAEVALLPGHGPPTSVGVEQRDNPILWRTVTPSFLDKLLSRLDRLGPDQMQSVLMRLIREKGFLEKVFEALQEGVIILTPDGQATFINRAAGRLFSVDPAGAVGRPLHEIIVGLEWKGLVGDGSRAVSRDLEIFYPENRYLNLYAAPITDEGDDPGPGNDQPLGCVLLIRDLTQTRRMTEEKIESERLNTLTLLAAGVAHELGNPLNSLNIHLQLLERKLRKSSPTAHDAVREQLEVARGEIKRLDLIIAQFLAAIRPTLPQLEPDDLNQLIRDAVRFLEPEIKDRRLHLTLELNSALPFLPVDAGQMKQAFYNLIRNAAQATPPGGRITIRTDFSDYEATVTVTDTGSGIPVEQMGHMFEPFYTTKGSGTGLGLLIVRRIVREHGGELAIESAEHKGTRITIRLPLGPRPMRMLPEGNPSRPPPG